MTIFTAPKIAAKENIMQDLTNPKTIKSLMQKHGVHFSKRLGQNFIVNPGVCPKIAEAGGAGPGVGALEIGPGIGALTRQLAGSCERVVSVEIDKALLPVLGETLADCPNVRVINADALKIDLRALIGEHLAGLEVIVCANLPYYITSPVLMRLLESRLPIRAITVMVQKEAAQRICAPLPSRQAGAITAAVHYYSAPRQLFTVSKGSFLPAPKVDSAVIRLDIRKQPPVQVQDEALLFRVVRGAFAQRRKTMLNSLSSALSLDKGAVAAALERAGVPPAARPEALTMEAFAAITNALE